MVGRGDNPCEGTTYLRPFLRKGLLPHQASLDYFSTGTPTALPHSVQEPS
jgi:hypothetical protein